MDTLASIATRLIVIPRPKNEGICRSPRTGAETHAKRLGERPPFWYSNLISGIDGLEGNNLGEAMLQGLLSGVGGLTRREFGFPLFLWVSRLPVADHACGKTTSWASSRCGAGLSNLPKTRLERSRQGGGRLRVF